MSDLSPERQKELLTVVLDVYRAAGPMEPSPVDLTLAVEPLIAEWLAEAWSEGWEANDDRVRSFENPYRGAPDAAQ